MKSTKKGTEKHYYKLVKDKQVYVEAVLIGLINTIASITIKQPRGKTTVTHSFIPIKSIEFSATDVVDFEYTIKRSVEERRKYDIDNGVSSENARRRKKYNRTTMSINLLIDLMWMNEMDYTSVQSIGKNGALIIEYIKSIHYRNHNWNLNEIKNAGKQINDYFLTRLENGSFSVMIERNDPEIRRILGLE